ncbi:Zinc transporter ZupT [Seminavis robusta]|uniref:Zinc transporter ZupT n=1 Tax=Seminavis robusta TaxID=568900 RepID=A0A9N8DXL9_9STRA|nr:Zinc transporter ZupT [Seminavis robusta]|eukprot:Sro357_g125630.1 Zinc transporter ZupT (410) ;mRNA; r:32568-33797
MGATIISQGGDYTSKDVAVAFAITILAGLATAVGGAIVFFPSLSRQFNAKLLSGGLALAAGSITYLAFVDIFPESTEFFAADATTEQGENLASTRATLCFFSGILIMYALDAVTHKISPHSHSHDLPVAPNASDHTGSTKSVDMAEEQLDEEKVATKNESVVHVTVDPKCDASIDEEAASSSSELEDDETSRLLTNEEKSSLWRSGLSTALALILHNVPEGLITYVSTVNNPSVGAALAIGIALHNLPEGSSVSLPIYFATGNKCKAFLTSVIAAMAPILGGLIGYAILETRDFSNTAFGVLHGVSGGMLIYIAVNNLMATSYKYDPENKSVIFYFVLGMALIAIALVILDATGNHDHAGGHGSSSHHAEGSVMEELGSVMEELVASDDHLNMETTSHHSDGHAHAHTR